MNRGSGAPMLRAFFALQPSAIERQALVRCVAGAVGLSDGRPVPETNAHLTLAFLGAVPRLRLAQLVRIGSECAAALARRSPLVLSFGTLEHWVRPQILVVLPAGEPARLAALAAALGGAIAAAGFTPELKPFRAHVTVARKVLRPLPLPAMPPLQWHCERVALFDSRSAPDGPVYSVVESFSLVKRKKVRE